MAAKISFDLNDLKFFGTVSASISHEMKNVLAIINEMMGLLDDLGCLAASGKPFDINRLQQIATRMRTQIQRGNDIMQTLNRFAHSVDHEEQSMDLADMAGFISGLARRRAALHNVNLEAAVGSEPTNLTANAFALEHLLWACLEQAVKLAGEGTTVQMTVNQDKSGPCIRFGPLAGMQEHTAGTNANHQTKALAERLGAELTGKPAVKELVLHLPAKKTNP